MRLRLVTYIGLSLPLICPISGAAAQSPACSERPGLLMAGKTKLTEQELRQRPDSTSVCVAGKMTTLGALRQQHPRPAAPTVMVSQNRAILAKQLANLKARYSANPAKQQAHIAEMKAKWGTGTNAHAVSANTHVAASANTAVDTTKAVRPAIARASDAAGQPTDPVLIWGSGFGAGQGAVLFTVAAGREIAAPILEWTDTYAAVQVPDVTGLLTFKGWFKVRNAAGLTSDPVQFQFNPTIDVQAGEVVNIGQRAVKVYTAPSASMLQCSDADYSAPEQVYVVHEGAFFWGCDGVDKYMMGAALKNGWVVESAEVYSDGPDGSGSATLSGAPHGSVDPTLSVAWHVNPWAALHYGVHFFVRGPKGVPYI